MTVAARGAAETPGLGAGGEGGLAEVTAAGLPLPAAAPTPPPAPAPPSAGDAGLTLALLRQRKGAFDRIWLTTLVVAALAVAVPWYLRAIELDLARLAWWTFGFALVYLASSLVIDRLGSVRWLRVGSGVQQLAGLLFLGLMWHAAGGLANPVFLLVFALPVVGVALVARGWQPPATALAAVLVALAVGLAESPELIWYLRQIGVPMAPLAALAGVLAPASPGPYAGLAMPPAFLFVQLELFAVLLLTVALVADTVARTVERLTSRLQSTALARRQAAGLASAVLRAAPVPSVLVLAESHEVVAASRSFEQRLLLTPGELEGRGLLELVDFSQPEMVEGLLAAGAGEVPFVAYRVGSETRVARLRAAPIDFGEARYVHLSVDDLTDLYYLEAALDASADPLLVIGADSRLVYSNRAAHRLFEDLHFGADADGLLDPAGLARGWWAPGVRRRLERTVELDGRRYRAVSTAAPILGESRALTVLALHLEEETGG